MQLLLWALAMATVAIVPLWKSASSQVWLGHSSLLVLAEYVLSWDGVYPPYLAMATGLAAAVLFWRYMMSLLNISRKYISWLKDPS